MVPRIYPFVLFRNPGFRRHFGMAWPRQISGVDRLRFGLFFPSDIRLFDVRRRTSRIAVVLFERAIQRWNPELVRRTFETAGLGDCHCPFVGGGCFRFHVSFGLPSKAEISSRKLIHCADSYFFDHFFNGAIESCKNCARNNVVADIEFRNFRNSGERPDISVSQAMSGGNFEP